jgi:methylmalonyl-CoA carboxyltransferase large subunit
MKAEMGDRSEVAAELRAIRQELARLSDRVATLEAASAAKPSSPPAEAPSPVVNDEDLSEEIVLVISAAIAAFLGKKPRIRQIRLLGTAAWAQQGRITIQASHALATRHARSEH